MIVLTASTNDAGFGELVAGCALDWARSPEDDPLLCRGEAQAECRGRSAGDGTRPREGASRHPARGRRRLPSLGLPAGDDGLRVAVPARALDSLPRGGLEPAQPGGCPVWNADADWAAGGGRARLSPRCARCRGTGSEFLDVRHALDGHQLCDRRARRVGSEGPSPGAPSGFGGSPSSRGRAANRSTRTPTASVRSAPASAFSTRAPRRPLLPGDPRPRLRRWDVARAARLTPP